MNKPRIWFERPLLEAFAEDVTSRVTVLGPATDDHPNLDIESAQAIIAGIREYDGSLFDLAPSVVAVGRTGIGYDSVDIAEATRRGIAVVNAPDGPTTSTAEHTVALILAVAKQLRPSQQLLEEQAGEYYEQHRAVQLDGKTLGLLGFGRIARRVAGVGKAMGMNILAFDPYVEGDRFPSVVERADSLQDVLSRSDVVSIHVPLDDSTHHFIDSEALSTMKQGAVIVNAARGAIVDPDALVAALDSGHLLGAGLDVTEPEPLPDGHPLLGRTDVVVTPHVASGTPEARAGNFSGAFEGVLEILAGKRPANLVNPDVWDDVLKRLA